MSHQDLFNISLMLIIHSEIISSVAAGWLISNFNSFFVCKIRQIFETIKNRKLVAYWLMYRKKLAHLHANYFFPHCILIWILV
jgi:hypothetical protein